MATNIRYITADQVFAEAKLDGEAIIFHNLPDLGNFYPPRRLYWKDWVSSLIVIIPLMFLWKYIMKEDWSLSIYIGSLALIIPILMQIWSNRKLSNDENYRNLIITPKRLIQINRYLNFDDSLRIRYVDPVNIKGVEDKFTKGSWWATATTRDADSPILLALHQTEKVKAVILEQFVNVAPKKPIAMINASDT